MSIIIKGMKKPKSCLEYKNEYVYRCPLLSDIEDVCLAQGEDSYNCKSWEELYASCPLIELPPHGRLIDGDALRQAMYHEAFETDSSMQKWDSGCWIRYKMFEQLEEAAPTIIEAEEEE